MTLAEKLIISYTTLLVSFGAYKLGHNAAQALTAVAHMWAGKITAAAALSN